MNFYYNELGLHTLGECTITQTREAEGGDAVQRVKVSVRLMLDLFEATFADNYALVRQLQAALQNPQAVLRWQDSDVGTDYINQTVTLVRHDLPEDPNGWGTLHQRVTVEFYFYEQNLATGNMVLTVTGSGGPVSLGNVTGWQETTTVDRFSQLKSERRQSLGKLRAAGLLLSDTTLTLDERRAQLVELKDELEGAIDGDKETAIQFGTPAGGSGPTVFSQTVRVDEFEAEIDQANYAIRWSLSAHWTKFPDEADYATVEFNVAQRDENTGEQFLVVSGRIVATDEATARAKLAAIEAAVQTTYGYVSAQELRNESTAGQAAANEDGDVFLELNFTREWRRWRPDNQRATFKKTGGGAAVDFGNVRTWDLAYDGRRFNDMRSQRQHAGGRIDAAGTWAADPAQTLAVRRTALLALQQSMLSEVNNADGTLTYGAFSQVVRVESFRAVINQTITAIDWSFTAIYSLFPNEAGYATAEFNVAQRSAVEDGEQMMTFAGRIQAPDEALARAKLDSLRTGMLSTYGFTLAQQLRQESTVNGIYANGDATATLAGHEAGDGTTFIELTWTEEYRKRIASLLGYNMKVSTREDAASGLVMTTYSGHVIAGGISVSSAYAAALTKAQALGGSQETVIGGGAFLRTSTISYDKRQTQASNAEEFIRLEFTYEYQSKSTRLNYLELNVSMVIDAFGTDTVDVSGQIVARDFAAAQGIYSTLRTPYATALVRNERTGQSTAGPDSAQQAIRFEFSFQAIQLKNPGRVTYRYGIDASRDLVSLELQTRVHGSIFAFSEPAARAALAGLIGGLTIGGQLVRDQSTAEREYATESGAVFTRLDFDQVFVDRLTGISGVLEVRLTEEVQYSGTRWALQTTVKETDGSGGYDIPQDLSVASGSRMVRGSVTAADPTTAEVWAKKQRAFLTGDANNGHFPQPEKWETDYEWAPRVDGVATGVGANVRVCRKSFTFAEILPNYPAPN